MKVIFTRKDELDDYSAIADFFYDNEVGRIQTYIANTLNLDLHYLNRLDFDEKVLFISNKLQKEYINTSNIIDNKIIEINTLWDLVCEDVFSILSKEFDLKLPSNKPINAEFTLNVVCPRYLDKWAFDINYRKNNNEIILICIHEIIHFIWFEKWRYIFPNVKDYEYNAPSLSWLFSEIAIDAIMKESDLYKYCYVDKPAYKHFYGKCIDDIDIMEFFRKLYKDNNMSEFMIKGYDFILDSKDFFDKLK